MNVFQITERDLEYHTTLDKSDVGLWTYLVAGCYQIFDTKKEAEDSYKEVFINKPMKMYHPKQPRIRAVGRSR